MRMSDAREPAGRSQPPRPRIVADPYHDGWWYLTVHGSLSPAEVASQYGPVAEEEGEPPATDWPA